LERRNTQLDELELDYVASACGSRHDFCSYIMFGDLVVTTTSGLSLRLSPGETARAGDFDVIRANAKSRFRVDCTDTPDETVSGAIVRR
jgi:hypothetical protein